MCSGRFEYRPAGDGFTVISAMRRTQPEAVTLILTGFPDFDTALQALRSHVDDYLTKPADIQQLVAMLTYKLKTPGRKPLLQVKRVSIVLRENADAIVQFWFEAAERDSELSQPYLNSNTRTKEFSLRDPDGYYVMISALSAG